MRRAFFYMLNRRLPPMDSLEYAIKHDPEVRKKARILLASLKLSLKVAENLQAGTAG